MTLTMLMKNISDTNNLFTGVVMGERSICRWTRNEDFQYNISRFWEKN